MEPSATVVMSRLDILRERGKMSIGEKTSDPMEGITGVHIPYLFLAVRLLAYHENQKGTRTL